MFKQHSSLKAVDNFGFLNIGHDLYVTFVLMFYPLRGISRINAFVNVNNVQKQEI